MGLMMRNGWVVSVVMAVLAFSMGEVQAQELSDDLRYELEADRWDHRPADAEAEARQGTGLRYRLAALGGTHRGSGGEFHLYGGAEAGILYGRFGAMALAQMGGGAGRSSALVGGGPAMEVVDLEVAALTAYGGLAWYEESLNTPDVSRDLTGPYGAVSIRVPLPVGAVVVGGSVWHGRSSGDGVVEEASATGRRLSLGFGL